MAEFYNNVVAFFRDMSTIYKIILVGVLVMLALVCFRIVIKLHANAKKFKLKIVPIIFTVLFLALAVFICSVGF